MYWVFKELYSYSDWLENVYSVFDWLENMYSCSDWLQKMSGEIQFLVGYEYFYTGFVFEVKTLIYCSL